MDDKTLILLVVGLVIASGLHVTHTARADVPAGVEWIQLFENKDIELLSSARQTPDGGYVAVGHSQSFEADYYVNLIKTDSGGKEVWHKKFLYTGIMAFHPLRVTNDGGFIIGSSVREYLSESESNEFIMLLKTNSDGNKEWERTFEGGVLGSSELMGPLCESAIQQTGDNGYIIIGLKDGASWLIKTDANGNKVWDKTFEGGCGQSIQQTTDGGFIIGGSTGGYSEASDFLLTKTGPDGDKEWERTFDNKAGEWCFSVCQTSDGGYITAGITYPAAAGDCDIWLVKTDSSGYVQWDRAFGGTDNEWGYSVQQTADNGFIIGGLIEYASNRHGDVLLMKIGGDGEKLWEKTADAAPYNAAYSVQQTDDGGFILAGVAADDSDLHDAKGLLVKVGPGGDAEEPPVEEDENPEEGLVGCWHFDEGNGTIVYDSSGNSNDGTVYGAKWRTGVSGNALSFDGLDDYVDCGKDATLDLSIAGTIEAWVYIDSYDPRTGYYPHIAGKGANAGWDNPGYTLWIRYDENNRGVYGYVAAGTRDSQANGISFGKPSTNVWHHLIFTWDGNYLSAYIDGWQYGSPIKQTFTPNSYGKNFLVAMSHSGDFYHGYIDEVRIYNRALTPSEIRERYEEFMPSNSLVEKKALLIGCWNYQDCLGYFSAAKNNLNAVKELLHEGFDFDISNIDICRNPSLSELAGYMDMLTAGRASDIKFIYYTGHAFKSTFGDKSNEALYLSGDCEKYYDYELGNKLNDATNLCAIFDTCFSGGLCHEKDESTDMRQTDDNRDGIYGDSKVIGMSTESEKPSYSDDEYSIFTWYVIEAFTFARDSAAIRLPGDDTRVSVEEALDYAKTWTEIETSLKILLGKPSQIPQVYDAWPSTAYNVDQFYLSDSPINNFWSVKSSCPVHLHVYDENFNHVGLNESGGFENGIPGVIYSGPYGNENELLVAFNPGENDDINIVVEAYNDGSFSLECKDYTNSNKSVTTLYENITIASGSKAYISVRNSIFGDAEVDDGSDGTIDRVIYPTVIPIGESDEKTTTTPGFEAVFIIFALALIFLLRKRGKD